MSVRRAVWGIQVGRGNGVGEAVGFRVSLGRSGCTEKGFRSRGLGLAVSVKACFRAVCSGMRSS